MSERSSKFLWCALPLGFNPSFRAVFVHSCFSFVLHYSQVSDCSSPRGGRAMLSPTSRSFLAK